MSLRKIHGKKVATWLFYQIEQKGSALVKHSIGREYSKLFCGKWIRQFNKQSYSSNCIVHRYLSSKKEPDVQPGILIGFCNPLLDITVSIKNTELLEKYGLQANAAILAEEKHKPLFEELTAMENVKYSAGGSGQNTLRVFQWIIGVKYASRFYGGVGKDKDGEKLEKHARADGVDTQYHVTDSKPTGTCAVIVSGQNRSLIANLGAAMVFTDDFMNSELNKCTVEHASYFYITCFFLAVCPATVMRVAKFSLEKKRTIIINLSAEFIMQTNKKEIDEVMPYTDILIGNKEEMQAFAAARNWDTKCITEIGQRLQCWEKKGQKPRMIIITDAEKPIKVFLEKGTIKEYEIPAFDKKDIVDTNGCGDSIIGGFLAMLCKQKDLEFCIKTGIWAAQEILKVVGVSLENVPKFDEKCIK